MKIDRNDNFAPFTNIIYNFNKSVVFSPLEDGEVYSETLIDSLNCCAKSCTMWKYFVDCTVYHNNLTFRI